jgi:hypothetical protein
MGLFDRAKKTLGLDGAEARPVRGEQWGRIVAVKSRLGPQVTLEVEVHEDGREPRVVSITTTPLSKTKPEVGQDVALDPSGSGHNTTATYRIKWDEAPRYGIPEPSQQQLQDAVAPGLLTDSPAAKPPGLEDAERMRDAGEISEEGFQTMKANILRPGEELDRLHDSGVMSDEIYANAKASEARFAAGVEIGAVPTPAEAMSNLDHAMDDSVELDLQQRGVSARATVIALPEPDPGDRFSLRMPLDVQPGGGGPTYRVECVFPAARPVDRLAVGMVLPVKVDPDDRDRVAVIWNLWLADLR